jgi:hypothetical protein
MFTVKQIDRIVSRKSSVKVVLIDGSVLYRKAAHPITVSKLLPITSSRRICFVRLNGFRDTPLKIVETWTTEPIIKGPIVGYNLDVPVYPDNENPWVSLQNENKRQFQTQ